MAKVSRTTVASVINNKLAKSRGKQLARELAAYLLETNRTSELDSLIRDVIGARARSGVIEATAVSAHELTPAATSDIKAEIERLYPGAKEIIINERIDIDQIGGVRLELPDKQLDLSVRGKLNHLKQLITEK